MFRLIEIPKENRIKISLWHLRRYIKKLNEKYKGIKFYIKKVIIDNKTLYMLNYITLEDRIDEIQKQIITLIEEYKKLNEEYEPIKEKYEKIKNRIERIEKSNILFKSFCYFYVKALNKKLKEMEKDLKFYKYGLSHYTKKIINLRERRNRLKDFYTNSNIEITNKRIPIYFDLENKKIYVDKEDYEKEPNILFRILTDLGISQEFLIKAIIKGND